MQWRQAALAGFAVFTVWITYEAKRLESRPSENDHSSELLRKAAPDFSLPRLNGPNVSLRSYRGKPVLVSFWASWCGPCRMEMPLLEAAYRKYGGRIEVVAVSVDRDPQDAAHFARESKLSFPVALDTEGATLHKYGVDTIPALFVVGKDGVVVSVHHGLDPRFDTQLNDDLKRAGEDAVGH